MRVRPVWPFAALLVIWGNAVPWLLGPTARLPGGSWAFVAAGVLLVVISLITARAAGLTTVTLGLDLRRAPRGAAIGAIVVVAAIVGLAAIRIAAFVVGHPVAYQPVLEVSADELVRHLVFFLPFGGVLPEEIAFRGTLLGMIAGRYGARSALVASAATFALWHGIVIVSTIGATTIAPPSPWAAPAMIGALGAVFGGGVVFAALRLRTGTIASSIVAHWGFNAVLLAGLRAIAA